MHVQTSPQLIMTADDFGMSSANNAGILAAYRAGVIHAASVMIAEPAAAEALEIARQNPGLAVGLHLSLSGGKPLCPPAEIPLLVQADGWYPPNEATLYKAILSQEGRAQMRREIAAQLDAFFATGLRCSHLDVHRNSHRHPVVAQAVFKAAASRGIRNIRIPFDPVFQRKRRLGDPLRYARVVALRRIAAFYGLKWADRVISRDWSDPERIVSLIGGLPPGVTELFFHPVATDGDHMFKVDLPSLLDPRVKMALTAFGERGAVLRPV